MRAALGGLFHLVILGATLVAASAEPIQSYDTYKSWLVACDNALSCVAKGFADGSQGPALQIERAAGPKGALSIRMSAESQLALAAVAVDGGKLSLREADWSNGDEEATKRVTRDPRVARAFLARLRDGKTLSLGSGGEVPLDGLVAALIRIDERQGRIGSVTALIATGEAPAGRVPPAPPLPTIPGRPIEARLTPEEALRLTAGVRRTERAIWAKAGCQDDTVQEETEAHALDKLRALVFIPCLRGAYQSSALGFIVSREDGSAKQLIAPVPYAGNDTGRRTAELFTDAGFYPETGTLVMSARGRALGDCGMSASWIWNGSEFQLAELLLQQSCGGDLTGWPSLFRSIQ